MVDEHGINTFMEAPVSDVILEGNRVGGIEWAAGHRQECVPVPAYT